MACAPLLYSVSLRALGRAWCKLMQQGLTSFFIVPFQSFLDHLLWVPGGTTLILMSNKPEKDSAAKWFMWFVFGVVMVILIAKESDRNSTNNDVWSSTKEQPAITKKPPQIVPRHNQPVVKTRKCGHCQGDGKCYKCDGAGHYVCYEHDTNGDGYCEFCGGNMQVDCIYCNGGTCDTCKGKGYITIR